MKVLLVTGSYPPLACGVGDYSRALAEALAREPGIEVAVLTSRGASDAGGAGVSVFPVIDRWHLAEAGRVRRVLKEWQPEVVHVQYPTQGYGDGRLPSLVPALAKGAGARVVRTWHEIPSLRNAPTFLPQALVPGPYVVVRPNFEERLPALYRSLLRRKRGGFVKGASSIPRSTLNEAERSALRARYVQGLERLIVYFGFLYPFKGVELLFEIADPKRDRLIIAGEAGVDKDYAESLRARAEQPDWAGRVTFTGYLSDSDTADLLAAADAVVLPFRHGGGIWNSSIHAAALQGTPVIATSREAAPAEAGQLVRFTPPEDLAAMRAGLADLAGKRGEPLGDEWKRIAREHLSLYRGGSLPELERA